MKSKESLDERRNTMLSLKEYGESMKDHKLDLAEEYISRMSIINDRESSANNINSVSIKKRKYTLNVKPSTDQKFLRVLIPFDLEIKKFYLPPEELEIYDVKDYIQQTIDRFNTSPEFRIHEDYQGHGIARFLSWILFLIIHLLFGYLNLCLLMLTYGNIILIVILFKLHVNFQTFVSNIFKNYYNKNQLKCIKDILIKENETEYCTYRKYTWSLGEVGYWLEMRKGLD